MNSVAKIVIGILAGVGALYVGTLILSMIVNPCPKQYLGAMDSPDQERRAVVELRSCPDQPYTELRIWVTKTDRRDVEHGAVLAKNPATNEIYLEWSANRSLVLRYPPALKINNRPSSLGDVEVSFELLER